MFKTEKQAVDWVRDNTPFAVKPNRKAKSIYINPFSSVSSFEKVVEHLGKKLFLKQNEL